MALQIPFNPYGTTNAAGSFSTSSGGYVQGVAQDGPATRFSLRGGILGPNETLPMFGGIPVFEQIPNPVYSASNPNHDLGPIVGRATTLTKTSVTGIAGFAVFNQNDAAVTSSSSAVPLIANGGQVNFYRLGSGAKVPVACDPGLASIVGGSVNQNVSWDFNAGILVPYAASSSTIAASTYTWSATNGGQLTVVAASATTVQAVGDEVYITGATNTGTGGVGVVNGIFTVNTFTDSQHFTLSAPGTSTIFGTIGGSPLINQGGGALGVAVDDFEFGHSMTINFNPNTLVASWNRTGSTALITI